MGNTGNPTKASTTTINFSGATGNLADPPQVGDWIVGWVATDNITATTPTVTGITGSTGAVGTITSTLISTSATAGGVATLIMFRAQVTTAYTGAGLANYTITLSGAVTSKLGGMTAIYSSTGATLTFTQVVSQGTVNTLPSQYLLSADAPWGTNTATMAAMSSEAPSIITLLSPGSNTLGGEQQLFRCFTTGGSAVTNISGVGYVTIDPVAGGNWTPNTTLVDGGFSVWKISEPGLASVTSSRDTTWNTSEQVTANRNTTWNVSEALTSVTSSRATTWNTRALVTANRQTTWNTRAPVTANRQTTWNALQTVNVLRSTTWNVLKQVTNTRTTTWNALAPVTANRNTTWNVQGLASVTAVRATTWNVLQTVNVLRSTTWNVRLVVSQSRSTTWNTFAPVTSLRVTTWNTRAPVTGSKSTTWNTLLQVAANRSSTWNVTALTSVTASRSTTWWVQPNISPPYSNATKWNTPLATLYPGGVTLRSDSSTLMGRVLDGHGTTPQRNYLGSDTSQSTLPVYYVDNSTPLVNVRVWGSWRNGSDDNVQGTYQVNQDISVPMPALPKVVGFSDYQIVIVNVDTGDEWNFWKVGTNVDESLQPGLDGNSVWQPYDIGSGVIRYTCQSAARYGPVGANSVTTTGGYITGNGKPSMTPQPWGMRGAKVPYGIGLVRKTEVQSGVINHAIAWAYHGPSPDFVDPAQGSDGGTFGGVSGSDIPEGARIRLRPDFDLTSFPAGTARIVGKALQDYGAIMIDNSGWPKVYLEADPTANWTDVTASMLSAATLADYQVVEWVVTTPPPSGLDLIGTAQSGGSATAVASITVTLATGVPDNSYDMVGVNVQAAGIGITTPSGWTLLKNQTESSSVYTSVFYRKHATGDPATVLFNFTGTTSQYGWATWGVTGADLTTAFGTAVGAADATSDVNHVGPALTMTGSGSMQFEVAGLGSGSTVFNTPPSGMTQVVQNSGGKRIAVASGTNASPGTLGASTWVLSAAARGTVIRFEVYPGAPTTTSVTSSRSTTWNTGASVTSLRVTTWNTRSVVATASRATTWNTRSVVSSARATTWNALQQVIANRSSTWNVSGAIVSVTSSRATTWNVLTSLASARSTTWNVLAVVAGTRSTTWHTRASVVGVRSSSWNVLAAITATKASTWNTLALATGSRQTTWNTLFSQLSSRQTMWNTRATVATVSRQTTWNVLTVVGTVSRSTSWNALQQVTVNRSTTWDTAGSAVTITSSRSTTWNTFAQVSGVRSTTWNVRLLIVSSRQTLWNTWQSTGTASRSTTWNTFATVIVARSTTWNTSVSVLAVRSTTWHTRALASSTRATTWNTFAKATGTRSTSWQTLVYILVSRATTWKVRQAVSASRATMWNVASNGITWDVYRAPYVPGAVMVQNYLGVWVPAQEVVRWNGT